MSRIFISYANADGGDAAGQLADVLESASRPCWIAPRDVLPGVPYPGQIVRAIRESRGLVLLLTPGANQSQAVLQEVELAHNEHKIIVALMVRSTEPCDDLRFFLSVRHRLVWTEARAAAAALGAVFAATQEECSGLESQIRGDRLRLRWRWPPGCSEVLIGWRADSRRWC
jgi:hypothetical protein